MARGELKPFTGELAESVTSSNLRYLRRPPRLDDEVRGIRSGGFLSQETWFKKELPSGHLWPRGHQCHKSKLRAVSPEKPGTAQSKVLPMGKGCSVSDWPLGLFLILFQAEMVLFHALVHISQDRCDFTQDGES